MKHVEEGPGRIGTVVYDRMYAPAREIQGMFNRQAIVSRAPGHGTTWEEGVVDRWSGEVIIPVLPCDIIFYPGPQVRGGHAMGPRYSLIFHGVPGMFYGDLSGLVIGIPED